jgi:hypothetical protein
MRFTNGILAATLALGALTLPALAGSATPAAGTVKDADGKSGCVAAQKPVSTEGCAAKITVDSSNKAKNLKPVAAETTGSALPLTTRAAHPRR